MSKKRNFTVVLTEDEAAKVETLTKPFGGSVGGFARNWVTLLSELAAEDLKTIEKLAKDLSARQKHS